MAKKPEVSNAINDELEWIQLKNDTAPIFIETFTEKFARKFKENPLVPIGCAATASALGFGLYSFHTGNSRMSQIMMRARVIAQGFTVAALVIGICLTYNKRT